MNTSRPLFGGIELGGTKCIGLIGTAPNDVRAQCAVPTGEDPQVTLARLREQFLAWRHEHGDIRALGIASFGPVDLAKGSRTFGHITSTGKPGWRSVDVVGSLRAALDVPTGFDTDVNGAALAEARWGAGRDLEDLAYVTVGTGVGVGLIARGALVHGFAHPEVGHVRVPRPPDDSRRGACPLHEDCVEGFASGPAIQAHTGLPPQQLGADDPVWQRVAHALGQLLHGLVATMAPRRILMGGGVMQARPHLLADVRGQLLKSLNGYVNLEGLAGPIDDYVVAPGLGAMAGPLGALALAIDAHAAH
jgi:fructokinase